MEFTMTNLDTPIISSKPITTLSRLRTRDFLQSNFGVCVVNIVVACGCPEEQKMASWKASGSAASCRGTLRETFYASAEAKRNMFAGSFMRVVSSQLPFLLSFLSL